jgi:hypothetical protein
MTPSATFVGEYRARPRGLWLLYSATLSEPEAWSQLLGADLPPHCDLRVRRLAHHERIDLGPLRYHRNDRT